jgi:hypothetical protein
MWRAVALPKPPDFQPAMGRALVVCSLMAAASLVDIADSAIVLPDYLNLTLPTDLEGELVTMFQVFGFGFHAVWIAAAVAFAIWLHRVVRNLPALGETRPYASPAWAVAWLLIPFVNLFLPFVIVEQAWQASDPAPDASGPEAPGRISLLLVAWWTAWLVGSPVSMIIEGAVLGYVLPASQSGLFPWYISYPRTLLFAVTVALAITVVLSLQRRQEARLRRLAAEAGSRVPAHVGSPAGA